MTDSVASVPVAGSSSSVSGIKVARPDIMLADQEVIPIELMTDLIFEDIGGQEIINIARNDLINGQNITYQPIKNATSLSLQYNPQNILSLQNTSQTYFKNFPIDLAAHIPEVSTQADGSNIYMDASGNLTIEVINMAPDEQVEVQIFNSGTTLDDTIY